MMLSCLVMKRYMYIYYCMFHEVNFMLLSGTEFRQFSLNEKMRILTMKRAFGLINVCLKEFSLCGRLYYLCSNSVSSLHEVFLISGLFR
jgi:hypothetical protein